MKLNDFIRIFFDNRFSAAYSVPTYILVSGIYHYMLGNIVQIRTRVPNAAFQTPVSTETCRAYQ